MAARRARAVQRLSHTLLRITAESCPSTIGLITLDPKLAGERSAGNPHATFDEAGNGNQLTVRLLRHSQRKRRETARPHLRSMAPFLDPTFREERGNVGIMRSPVRASFLPGKFRLTIAEILAEQWPTRSNCSVQTTLSKLPRTKEPGSILPRLPGQSR